MLRRIQRHLGFDDDITNEQTVHHDRSLYDDDYWSDRSRAFRSDLRTQPNMTKPSDPERTPPYSSYLEKPHMSVPGRYMTSQRVTSADSAIAALDNEIENEHRLQKCLRRVNESNAFLFSLEDAVDRQSKSEEKEAESIPKKYEDSNPNPKTNEDYDALRQEYINELQQYQKFYKSYQSLLVKYQQLKSNGVPLNTAYNSAKSKLHQLESLSTTPTMKDLCQQAIQDIESINASANSYKQELADVHARIRQLENR